MRKTTYKRKPPIIRFVRKCKRGKKKTDCWIWQGGKSNKSGYGAFTMGVGHVEKGNYAHRASWWLFRGPIPKGMLVLHRCDVKLCVNPDHLFLGSHADNVADKVRKGRGRNGFKSILTEHEVREIRKLYVPYAVPYRVLAKEFCVCEAAIADIIKGRRWEKLK